MSTYYYKLIFKTDQDTSYTKYYKRQAESQYEALQIVKHLIQRVVSRYKIGKIKKTKIIPLTKEEYYVLTGKERNNKLMPKYYQVLLETPYSVSVEKFCISNNHPSNYLAERQAFESLTKKAESDYFKCKNDYPDYEAFFEDCNYELERISKKEFYNKGENKTMNKDLTTLILEKLAAGQTAEDIASEVSDAINKAEAEATIKSEKAADTKELLIAVAAYLAKYYPEIEIDGICTDPTDKDVEEVMEIIDNIANFDKLPVFSFPFGRLFR